MKKPLCLTLIHLLIFAVAQSQSPPASSGATNPVQVSPPEGATSSPSQTRQLKIPAGTPVEIEAAYTVNSLDVRPEDLISFRVIVPIKVDGVTVIEKYSLVTGRVVEAKRGQHWGRAGKLSWIMQDVVAIDLTRVPLQARNDSNDAKNAVKGTSHAGQVATEMIVFGSLMWVIAPVVLLHGFKRGENAVLPEGKRFIVFVKQDTVVKIPVEPTTSSSTVVAP
jgi:hypothetical protein